MLSCLIVGCKDEDIRYSIERPDDTMHLQVSNEYVELNQKFGKEEAVTFSWNEVTNAPLDSKVTYYLSWTLLTMISALLLTNENSGRRAQCKLYP